MRRSKPGLPNSTVRPCKASCGAMRRSSFEQVPITDLTCQNDSWPVTHEKCALDVASRCNRRCFEEFSSSICEAPHWPCPSTQMRTHMRACTCIIAQTFEGQGIKVAVLDTGINADHPEFAGIYKGGKNFIPNSSTYTKNRTDDDASETSPVERAADRRWAVGLCRSPVSRCDLCERLRGHRKRGQGTQESVAAGVGSVRPLSVRQARRTWRCTGPGHVS